MAQNSGEGPYAFKTLWQEITRAVGYAMTTVTDAIGLKETGKTNRLIVTEQGKTDRQGRLLDATKGSNTLPTILLIGVIVVAVVYFWKGNRK